MSQTLRKIFISDQSITKKSVNVHFPICLAVSASISLLSVALINIDQRHFGKIKIFFIVLFYSFFLSLCSVLLCFVWVYISTSQYLRKVRTGPQQEPVVRDWRRDYGGMLLTGMPPAACSANFFIHLSPFGQGGTFQNGFPVSPYQPAIETWLPSSLIEPVLQLRFSLPRKLYFVSS